MRLPQLYTSLLWKSLRNRNNITLRFKKHAVSNGVIQSFSKHDNVGPTFTGVQLYFT